MTKTSKLARLSLLAATLLAAAIVAGGSARPDEPAAPISAAVPITWTDVNGERHGAADLAAAKATVFVFAATQCPISNQYTSRINALATGYAKRGVRFVLVNSDAADSRETVIRDARARKVSFPVVKDNGTMLADRLGASTTPEAIIVDPAGVVRYLGRIDDNADPAKITRHDAREALDDLLAGRPVARARTRAFGCEIFRDVPAPVKVASASVTYARDVAPILNENCVVCHRAGDVGPFALERYEQAKVWAKQIKDYSARRIMPPWKAAPLPGVAFHDARWLSDRQIATLGAWADAGAPLGEKKNLPPAPKLFPPGDWPLGKPDVVAAPARPYHLSADGRDVYRNFALPIDFDQDRYVSAFDFKPTNRQIVHHIIAYIDPTGETAAAKEGKETEPGWSVSGGGSGIANAGWGDGWAPGMTPRRLEKGVAVKIPRGAKLVLQIHYHKTGKPEVDQSQVALYFAKEPAQHVLQTAPLGNPLFVLQPGVAGQEVKAALIAPFDLTVRTILPHMHLLGKTMRVWATLPDGTEKTLIKIENWEFNWQTTYRYVQPVRLPKGTRVSLVATYDNTTANPNQPFNPPQLVHFGEQTTDEMCFAFVGFTRDAPNGDQRALAR